MTLGELMIALGPAFPSASKVIAAPEATISNTSSAELTSAATYGASPPRESTASQKSRAGPAEAGRAATGSPRSTRARLAIARTIGGMSDRLDLPAGRSRHG